MHVYICICIQVCVFVQSGFYWAPWIYGLIVIIKLRTFWLLFFQIFVFILLTWISPSPNFPLSETWIYVRPLDIITLVMKSLIIVWFSFSSFFLCASFWIHLIIVSSSLLKYSNIFFHRIESTVKYLSVFFHLQKFYFFSFHLLVFIMLMFFLTYFNVCNI